MWKAKKEALTKIEKTYELIHNYLVGKAQTQWDKIRKKCITRTLG